LFVIDLVYVSIHAPARGATHVARLNIKYPLFQSTPPHGGRQHLPPLRLCSCHVSIHAPARGATLLSSVPLLPIIVSIHAPARGATPSIACCPLPARFNPRPRTGGDFLYFSY